MAFVCSVVHGSSLRAYVRGWIPRPIGHLRFYFSTAYDAMDTSTLLLRVGGISNSTFLLHATR